MRNGIIFGAAMADKKQENGKVRYSAAYPTGRELMLEPRYGCAGESFAFGGKPHEVRQEGPQGAARERIVKGLLYHGV